MSRAFEEKWQTAVRPGGDERTLFVSPGQVPRTQRQFNLFSYYQSLDRLLGTRPITRAAEFGCGRGTMGQYLSVYREARVSLIDNSPAGIDLAKENMAAVGKDADFVCADAASTGLPSESFDVVVSIGLLEHIPEYRTVLLEQFRLLKPGGLAFNLNIPGKWSVQRLNDLYKKIIAPFAPAGTIRKDYYRNTDRPEAYASAARDVGFVHISTVDINPYPIWTPVPPWAESMLSTVYRGVHALRGRLKKEPMATGRLLSQGHYLIGYKPPYVS